MFWDATAERDPWRDPEAPVALGPPPSSTSNGSGSTRADGARLSVRELLFGRRVQPRALAVLGLVALLIGAAGGLVGRLTADGAADLTEPDPSITQTVPGKERPIGSVSDIAARTVPAVVSIEIRVGDEGGTGSGVVIEPSGYVLTNNHVVAPAAEAAGAGIEAIFHDGTRGPARIVGRDPKTDLAVLKVDVTNPVVATVGSVRDLAVGDGVIAIGSPLGLAGTVTDGHRQRAGPAGPAGCPGHRRQRGHRRHPDRRRDQPGQLRRPAGRLDGRGGGHQHRDPQPRPGRGRLDRPRLRDPDRRRQGDRRGADPHRGGASTPRSGSTPRSVSDGTTDGAQVQNVQQGGPAAAAGILEGDVIVKVGDRPIAGADELVVAVREHNPGDTVGVDIVREGRPLTLSVVLASD